MSESRLDGRDPQAEIAARNPWYVEDQFRIQLGSPALRAVVEGRWRLFTSAIDDWMRSGAPAPSRILDAGCGDGINLSFFARLASARGWSSRIVGADYSPLRLARAGAYGAFLMRTSISALPFDSGVFDVIVCNHVLEHVPDDQAAMRELRRVVRPGGLVIIGVPNEGSPLGRLRNHVLQRSILRSTDHVNMYTADVLRERLTRADLRIVTIHPDGFFVPHTVLHSWLNRWGPLRHALNTAARCAPTCAAGLLAVSTR
jgi:SAM-dependent methyltransferase